LLYASAASFAIAAIAWGYNRYSGEPQSSNGAAGSEAVSVAVLNLSDEAATDSTRYLAEGLSEDIRTELARIPTIAVPSYASAKTYSSSPKPIRQIAGEMAVRFVVVGSIERTTQGSRVHVELVDGSTGESRWSRDYAPSRDGAMLIARHTVREAASAIGIALSREERDRLSQAPTKNPLAYEVYLRGLHAELSASPRTAMGTFSVPEMRRAQAFYSQARSLDPQFAAARARLAVTHMFSARTYDTTVARLDQARLEAETALRMDPRLAAPHDVLSAYWSQTGDLPKAIEQLETGLQSTPNDIALLLAASSRYLEAGRWEDAIERVELAARLDPRNTVVAFRAATSYGRLRRNDQGMKAFNRLLEITPDDHEVRIIKGQSYLRWKGTTDTLHASLERVPPDWDLRGMATFGRYTALMVDRRYRDVLSMLDRAPSDLSRDGLVYHPKSLMRAEAHHRLGDLRQARHHYEIARQELSDSAAARPKDSSIRSALALAYAGLNRKREAIAEAERAMALRRVSANNRNATAFMGIAVEVFGRVGEPDRAFEMIELMLTMPSGREITLPFLKVWPGFDSLRGDPRFNALIERFAIRAN
jgi:TolB-like protein/Flp pilus assembly protein TadD